MFAKLFGAQPAEVVLPDNPRQWSREVVDHFLGGLNPQKERDRAQVREWMRTLENAIQAEMRMPFTSVRMVLQSDEKKLPIQLRVFRDLHDYMRIWLW